MQKESKSELVVTSALALAAAFLLGLIKISSPWLYGGSVTLFSMVPIIIISFKMGAKTGFVLGINYGILKLILGTSNFIFLRAFMFNYFRLFIGIWFYWCSIFF